MIRGTTPTEVFTLKNPGQVNLLQCTQIWVTITDARKVDYKWELDRLVIDNISHTVSLRLTQEETLAFAVGIATVQLRFLYSDGSAFASRPSRINIEDVRKDGVIE